MIRRNARLRKEYIYRKSLEGTEREVYEKKRKIKDALASMCFCSPPRLGCF
jgi:U3 small nucleolar ribonucleoprotein protein IMP4